MKQKAGADFIRSLVAVCFISGEALSILAAKRVYREVEDGQFSLIMGLTYLFAGC